MDHVELAGGVGAELLRHPDAVAAVVRDSGGDQRQVAGAAAEVAGEHLRVAFEPAAGEHHRLGAEVALQPIGPADHDAVDRAVVGDGQPDGLGFEVLVDVVVLSQGGGQRGDDGGAAAGGVAWRGHGGDTLVEGVRDGELVEHLVATGLAGRGRSGRAQADVPENAATRDRTERCRRTPASRLQTVSGTDGGPPVTPSVEVALASRVPG